MRTDDLITVLAGDTRAGRSVWPGVMFAALGPVLLTGGVFLLLAGVRADLANAATSLLVVWKWVLPAILFGAGISLALTLARPESRPRGGWWMAVAAAAFGAGLFASRAVIVPPVDWIAAIRGQTLLICLASITSIGLTGVIGGLAVLRRGASVRPGLSGLAIGLGSGGAAALLYALHCNQDDPLFYVTWYGLAILGLGLVGAVAGARVLRI